ncbi:MAG TPA: O-antigen ligase family protein, partial [Vicinamibacteria bacterium]
MAGSERVGILAGAKGFDLRRGVLVLYGLLAVALSAVLLSQSLHRGPGELRRWLAAYVAVGGLSIVRPGLAPLAGGASAFLLGFVRTHQGGFNLDLGLGLVALSVGAWALWRARRSDGREATDLAGLALLALAAWSLVSLAFVFARIRSFRPAPGFDYHAYQFNPFGLSSEEALVRATIGATVAFLSFGLYLYGRTPGLDRRTLGAAVFLVLLANGAALLVQRNDPDFLRPAGAIPPGRLNGVTSFCYALGDGTLALTLLLPAWGAARGPGRARTVGSLVLLLQAAVASGSRTALLGLLAAVLLWGWALAVRRWRHRGALAALAATALLLWAGWAAYRATPPDQTTPLGRLKAGIETEGILGHLVEQRLHSYPLAFRVMEEYPLSGIGVGLYPAEVSKQRALLAPDLKVLDYLLTSYAPNQFLNVGVELGAPALAALVAAFAAVAFSLLRRGGPGAAAWLVSLAVLAAALQLGPALYNSEALVFG